MKNLKDLKKDIRENPEMRKNFAKIKNENEAAEIAKKLGYDVSPADLKNDEELNEDMLEAVAGGGKGDTTINRKFYINAEQGKYKSIDINKDTGDIMGYEEAEK